MAKSRLASLSDEARAICDLFFIVDKKARKVPFILNEAQCRYDRERTNRDIILKARQEGFSSFIDALITLRCVTKRNLRCVLIAHDRASSQVLFDRVKFYVENFRGGLRPDFGRSSRRELYFRKTNSTFYIGTAGHEQFGRGDTIHLLHCSEVAMWPNPAEIMAGLFQAVPAEGTIWIESTAKGRGNWFHSRCMRARDGQGDFKLHFFPWFVHEEYRKPPRIREDSLTEEERELRKKFNLTLSQLQWRRDKIAEMDDSDIKYGANLFPQEYPACLTRETKVSTERGILPISEALLCKRTESGVIKAAGPQPVADIYKLETKSGRVLRGTYDHPVHTPNGFVWLGDLVPGQKITLRPPMFSESYVRISWTDPPLLHKEIVVDEDLGRFIGYFMGDGSWHKSTLSIQCDGKDQDVIEDVRFLMRKHVCEPRVRVISRVQGRKGCTELRCGCTKALESFKVLGLINTPPLGGMYRREIHVPACIFQSPRSVVREFLRGLFESDGSATKEGIVRIASAKQQLVRDVQLLLLGFGITARISENFKKNSKGHQYKCWMLSLTAEESLLFHEKIGFVSKRKSSLQPAKAGKIGRPRRPVEMLDTVASVTRDGREVVYDLTIEPAHVFSANGILTHNTVEESFLASGMSVFGYIPHHSTPVVESTQFLTLYETPQRGAQYSIGADVGTGVGGSRSVAWILNCDTLEQAGEFVADCVDPGEFGDILCDLGFRFNQAFIVPELNNPGFATVETLRRKYILSKIIQRYQYDRRSKTDVRTERVGFLTSERTKEIAITNLRRAIVDGLKIYSDATRSEMSTFVEKPNGSLGAQEGCYDDRVIAAALAVTGYRHLYKPKIVPIYKPPNPYSFERQRQLAIQGFVDEYGETPSEYFGYHDYRIDYD